jgi:hypothetical protein
MRRFDRPVEAPWRLSSTGDRVLEIVERDETLAGAVMLPGRVGGSLP